MGDDDTYKSPLYRWPGVNERKVVMDEVTKVLEAARKVKTVDEIKDYIKFMEEQVTGIIFVDKSPDLYDKGWYDALRWVIGRWP